MPKHYAVVLFFSEKESNNTILNLENSIMPSVNPDSMAYILFLHSIFFLEKSMVPNDKVIARNLSRSYPPVTDFNIHKKEKPLHTKRK
jgi:hypothetical protein